MMHFILTRFWMPLVMVLMTSLGWTGTAHALQPAKERVVLTVSGKIATKNQGALATFDMAMLEALPQRTFTTLTPWENQPVKFSGPLLRDLLAAVKADGKNIKATAINDYRINIPVEDSQLFDVIVATRMNDAPMPVRAKGPLFIVYPFDAKPELKSNKYYERSIWQLKAIEVE
jgi:hypothetical protein